MMCLFYICFLYLHNLGLHNMVAHNLSIEEVFVCLAPNLAWFIDTSVMATLRRKTPAAWHDWDVSFFFMIEGLFHQNIVLNRCVLVFTEGRI